MASLATYFTVTRTLRVILRAYATLCLAIVLLGIWPTTTTLTGEVSLRLLGTYGFHGLAALAISVVIEGERRYWQYRQRLSKPDADIAAILGEDEE